MRLVVVGGSGKVGSIVLPALAEAHDVVVVDRQPPKCESPIVEYRRGDIVDPLFWDSLPPADGIVFLAMAPVGARGDGQAAAAQFDVSVRGLYLALHWAGHAGARRAVYASSMSVYATPPGGRYPRNDARPDAHRAYGLAKACGEEVCRAAADEWGMTVTALRLAHPSTEQEWSGALEVPLYGTATSPRDTVRAFQRALEREGEFITVPISGDASGRYVDPRDAEQILGWSPLDRLVAERDWPVAK